MEQGCLRLTKHTGPHDADSMCADSKIRHKLFFAGAYVDAVYDTFKQVLGC